MVVTSPRSSQRQYRASSISWYLMRSVTSLKIPSKPVTAPLSSSLVLTVVSSHPRLLLRARNLLSTLTASPSSITCSRNSSEASLEAWVFQNFSLPCRTSSGEEKPNISAPARFIAV